MPERLQAFESVDASSVFAVEHKLRAFDADVNDEVP